MKPRVILLLKYSIFWMIYFLAVKTIFLIFNYHFTESISFSDFLGVYFYGLKLDFSTVSYILILPSFMVLLSVFFIYKPTRYIINGYTYILLFIVCFLAAADMEIYKFWGTRLDTTPILYIKTPKDAMASIEWYIVARQIIIMAALIYVFIRFYKWLIKIDLEKINTGRWFKFPIILVLCASLVIPIRGGFGMPINTGSAYFSKAEFANHSAINFLWNFGYSLTELETTKNPYQVMDNKTAKEKLKALYSSAPGPSIKLLNTDRPNIILIIVESFTAKAIEPLGGIKFITPCFNRMVHDGVLFKNLYSSGVRSDKGLVAIMSGFPALPAVSIIRFPERSARLPYITKDLKNNGYEKMNYYYGGDIDFASMRSYIKNAGFDKTISETDFPASEYSNWGAPDQVTLNKLYDDVNATSGRFFYSLFTLSSHEPFDVPIKHIAGSDEDHKFMNSIYYTDSCIGNFIDKAKKTKWWKNTLIVITADHGVQMIDNTPNFEPLRFHEPMLWLGGALRTKDSVITNVCSQSDISLTILRQLNINPKQPYLYSHDILAKHGANFAYCAYNNGFAMITDTSEVSYDYTESKIKISKGTITKEFLNTGQAYMQSVYNHFMYMKRP
jgi:phosphoglycerol transferase MdoB-like AlkP superfamily enzyme